jgi:hypothetical protein
MKSKLIAPLFLACTAAGAQTISSLMAETNGPPMAGEQVTASIRLTVEPNGRAWCGLTLHWGNGKTVDRRVEDVSQPITFTQVYDRPGDYQLRVEGKPLTRGLNSASACEGSRTITLRVGDPVEARRAAAAAEEARRAAAEAEARRRELEAKERELKQKEADLAMKEREAALAKREAELKRKEAAAKAQPAAEKPAAEKAPAKATAQTPKKDSTLDVFK